MHSQSILSLRIQKNVKVPSWLFESLQTQKTTQIQLITVQLQILNLKYNNN